MRGTPLGWLRCPRCGRAVVVTTDASARRRIGVHWTVPNRRCDASNERVAEDVTIVATLAALAPLSGRP